MPFLHRTGALFSRVSGKRASRRRNGDSWRRPSVETLEPRRLLSVATSTRINDAPPASSPTSSIADRDGTWLAGDANSDGRFDQLDLVQVQIARKYMSGAHATWAEGDWSGDGLFDQGDLLAALQGGRYGRSSYAALASAQGIRGDDQTSIIYNPANGEIMVDAPASTNLTSINIDSVSGIFNGGRNIFRATFGGSFGSMSLGTIEPGLTYEFLLNDLTVVGSLEGGSQLGPVDLATAVCQDHTGQRGEIATFSSEEELTTYLRERPVPRNPFEPPLPIWRGGGSFDGGGFLGGSFDNDAGEGFGVPTHSETNTQAAGVDEADLVETDGNFIYAVSDSSLVISDAWPLRDLRVLSRWNFAGSVVGLYLAGDRLAVISRGERLRVTVLDVSDRAAPALVQQTEFDGEYVDSRAIGDHVYVVSASDFRSSSLGGASPDPGFPSQVHLPRYSASNAAGEITRSGLLTDPGNTYRSVIPDDFRLMSVTVFNAQRNEPGPTTSSAVPISSSARVHASLGNIYVVSPGCGSADVPTSILKLEIQNGGSRVALVAFGDVPGRPLDEFSASEYAGNVRIATAEGFGAERQNRIYVLAQAGTTLNVIGQTESMATGERIRSVRFLDETGYVVTFPEQLLPTIRGFNDPLFTVDLTDPTAPRLLGELEIPGFSSYLHPVGQDYVIGLGRDADQRTGRNQELQLSLFYVSDLTQPFQADRYQFELPVWAETEALDDHHAIAYYPEYHILALPVTNPRAEVSVDQDGDGRADITEPRPLTELWVFHIDLPGPGDPGAGIELLGRIQQSSVVRRSLRIEDHLFSVADDSLAVYPMVNPRRQVAGLYFGREDVGVSVYHADPAKQAVRAALINSSETPPLVLDVHVRGSRWQPDYIDYLDRGIAERPPTEVVAQTGIDEIRVTFSEDVFGTPNFALRGTNVSQYHVRNYAYDPESRTGIWTLDSPILADDLTLYLRGLADQSGNALDGDANGAAGGRFMGRIRRLTGDVNADGYVDMADIALASVYGAARIGEANYSAAVDLDGNGRIDISDQTAVREYLGSRLPRLAPRMRPGDVDGDDVFGQLDLVRVLQGAKYLTDEPARWVEGDWNDDGVFDPLDLVAASALGFTSTGRP